MSRRTDALKRVLVAADYGELSDYKSNTVVGVLKEFCVIAEIAESVENVRTNTTAETLDYIAKNFPSPDPHEPFDLKVLPKLQTHAAITVKRGGKTIATTGQEKEDILFNGDVLTITAVPDEGYTIQLQVNGVDLPADGKYTVNGSNVVVSTVSSLQTYALSREVDENVTVTVEDAGSPVEDGENVITYGGVLTITATASEGYSVASLKVNGEDFMSGGEYNVSGPVEIVATSEANAPQSENN